MAKSNASNASVTRIKASDSKKAKKEKSSVVSKKPTLPGGSPKPTRRNPLSAFFGYFKGAWYELRQVRWPNRRATWSLTGAVLAFAIFFIIFIALLDALFKYMFELILQ